MIDPERVVLGGFSMGGGLAILLTLRQSIKSCGFVVLAPYLSETELEMLSALLDRQKITGLRGYIMVGEKDTHCLNSARKIVEIMHNHHLPCKLELCSDLEHAYPPDFGEGVTKGLAFIEQACYS